MIEVEMHRVIYSNGANIKITVKPDDCGLLDDLVVVQQSLENNEWPTSGIGCQSIHLNRGQAEALIKAINALLLFADDNKPATQA